MAFQGKEYKLEKQENFEEFLNALGSELSPEAKQVLLNFKPSVKLVQSGDEFVLSSSKPDGSWSDTKFKSGVEFDDVAQGQPAKSTFTLNGNVLTQVQKFSSGTITYERQFSDNELVLTIKSSLWDGVAKRYYKA